MAEPSPTNANDSLPHGRAIAAFERPFARLLSATFRDGEPVIVACSGGPDSSSALVAVARARRGRGEVIAATFDHRLRPAADVAADIQSVRSLAGRLGVQVVAGRAGRRPGDSESSAREARYRWLASVCLDAGAGWCVTGHTMDDQAETVLLRLARGTGLSGAAGMDVVSAWPVRVRGSGGLRLLRPLLGIRRAEVEAYLARLGVEAQVDVTNETERYARNRVRHGVLPVLGSVNPRAVEAIVRFASLARRDDAELDHQAAEAFAMLARVRRGAVHLDRRAVRRLPAAIAVRVIALAAAAAGSSLDGGQTEAVLRGLGRAGSRIALSGGRLFHTTSDEAIVQTD